MSQNIPKVSFQYKDSGKLVPVPEGTITKKALILGCAVDGPVNIPVRVNSNKIEDVFGPIVYDTQYKSSKTTASGSDPMAGLYNGNSLVKAYAEVAQGGCTDIILMRVGDLEGTICAQATAFIADTPGADGIYKKSASQAGDSLQTLTGIVIKGKYPGSIYNGVGIKLTYTLASSAVTAGTLQIMQGLKQKGRTLTFTTTPASGSTLTKRQLVELINNSSTNTTIVAETVADDPDIDQPIPYKTQTNGTYNAYFVLDGGLDGTRSNGAGSGQFTTAKDVYTAMMGGSAAVASGVPDELSAFSRIGESEADICYMACIYADENIGTGVSPATILYPFGKAIHEAAKNDYPMVGVTGTKPATASIPIRTNPIVANLALTQHTNIATDGLVSGSTIMLKLGYYIAADQFTGTTTLQYFDPELGDNVDLGGYLQVVVSDVYFTNQRLGTYSETGAGIYAGLLTTVPTDRAVTNMVLPSVNKMPWSFTNKQISKIAGGQPFDPVGNISGNGGSYVVFRGNSAGSVIVNSDNTAAVRTSDYATYQVRNIVNEVAAGLKSVAEPYIGLNNEVSTRTSLDNAIETYLTYVQSTRAISGFTFSTSASGTDNIVGRINLDVTIRPSLQIKEVHVVISVAPPTT